MLDITTTKEFKEIIKDFNIKQFDKAIGKLSKLSTIYPNEYYIIKLYASIYLKKSEWNNAIKYYYKLLTFNKDKFKIYNNLGLIFFKLGEINKSIDNFKKSTNDLPNPIAYNNLGLAYNEIGKYNDSIKNYLAALDIDKNNYQAKKNLIKILTFYQPNNFEKSPIIKLNRKISEIYNKIQTDTLNNLEEIKKILTASNNIIKSLGTNFILDETEIFRRNSKNLNCTRHFEIYNEFNIIPKYCFSCYKVQITLFNVLDLIKLYFIFNDLYLKKNNIRKCMVEIRNNIKGNYKGYIYCEGLDEANSILYKVKKIIKKTYTQQFKIEIKHGCSEFYGTYPAFKNINFNGSQDMEYQSKWSIKENIIDERYPVRKSADKKILGVTNKGMSLSDMLIIKNWLAFAKILNDQSYKLIFENQIETNFIENFLKPQLNFRKEELKFNYN
jgi:tetratricopeptide (TPR) repeat protein